MALDMFLSPLVSKVVEKAADSVIQEFCKMWNMEDNREKLHLKLLGIQAKIADAEKQGASNKFVKACLGKLQAAAYEAVDVLDEFQYEALRHKAIRNQPSCSAKVIKDFFSSENPILFRQKISTKLIKLLGKIDEVVTEMNTFNFVPHDPIAPLDRKTHSFVIESNVIGRDGERDKIVNTLLDLQHEKDNISVLPIVGMGGLGKTTFTQLVYNHEKVQKHFQLLMWVCVSTEFDIITIVKSIIQVAEKSNDVSISNKEVLQQRLRELLNEKRYLLILDDVWNEEREKWDELKTLLFSGASSGSVIVVTTRSKKVASIMGTLPSHDLASLTEDDSWRLFEKRAFGAWDKKPSEELIEIGRAIVHKCAGIPLALNTMGGLMASKPDVHDWRVVAKNKIWEDLVSSKNILPILKLSYENIPTYMQQCFAFCAMFPQDYYMKRDALIYLWMANDFIPTDETMDLEEKGRQIFNQLCWRSFFQDIEEDDDTRYGLKITCKMHDLMHDLATQVAGKKCATQMELDNLRKDQKEVQHLFFSSAKPSITHVLNQFPNIHTLLVPNGLDYEIVKQYYSLKSSPLRALNVRSNKDNSTVLKGLGYMKHLRFLDLTGSSFNTLPESMSRLYNLQTLILSYSGICELPEGMRYMTNLRHIFLDGCENLKRMPIGLGELKCLRTLTKYVVDQERGGNIRELRNLNLCGRLSLDGLEKVRDTEDAEAVNLIAKSDLYSLEHRWNSEITTPNDQPVLEALRPPVGLKFLKIKGYGGSRFSKWMNEYLVMENIKCLELIECNNCSELPPVWQLPLLEKLNLEQMESLISIVGTCRNANENEPLITFPNLKELSLAKLPNLDSWHESDYELVTFPKLNDLEIYSCRKLKTIPACAPMLARLTVWESGMIKLSQISNLPMLSFLDISKSDIDPTETQTQTDFFKRPSTLKVVQIMGYENVILLEEEGNQNGQTSSLCDLYLMVTTALALGSWKRHFATLELLWIEDCDSLVYWPEEEFRSLKCLKSLYIHGCRNFIGSSPLLPSSIPSGEDSPPLPKLEILDIENCPQLVEVPISSMSLRELEIDACHKLSRKWSVNLTNLKFLKIEHCDNWEALPDNMRHLPSLERLEICGLPGLESLPEGLQQRLPSLRFLRIEGCPALERHCRRGGDYWHLMEHIPNLDIECDDEEEEEEITKSESFLTRLLPSCGKS